jgi:hypothetical protein
VAASGLVLAIAELDAPVGRGEERLEITVVDPTLVVEVLADVTQTMGHQGNSSEAERPRGDDSRREAGPCVAACNAWVGGATTTGGVLTLRLRGWGFCVLRCRLRPTLQPSRTG